MPYQLTQPWTTYDLSSLACTCWRVVPVRWPVADRLMRPFPIEMCNMFGQQVPQVSLAEHDAVVQSLEWHLLLGNASRHSAFHLGPGPGQPVGVVPPPLLQPRLVPV